MINKTKLPIVFCALAIITIVLAGWGGRQISYQELRQSALNELFRYRNSIQYLLERYQPLPEIIAGNPRLVDGLQNPSNQHDIDLYLEQMARASDASVIYLMDAEGNTIAASNWKSPVNFLGKNFSFRPYFQQAMAEGEGYYSALGTTSKTRGYYFARRIDINGKAAGVLVVKLDLDGIEVAWESPWDQHEAAFVVTDSNGVVFISTRAQWRFHTLQPLSLQQQKQLENERRYDNRTLPLLNFLEQSQPYSLGGTNSEIRRVGIPGQIPEQFLVQRVSMADADWKLYLFIRTTSVYSTMLVSILITAGFLILALFGWLYWRERRRRFKALQKARDTLNTKVQQRTRELSAANHQLVQTAKLAVLGQMSAGINHELNQPLTAIRSYTENAIAFLERGKQETAQSNLHEILHLTDHMSSIVHQLKAFARKSDDTHQITSLPEAIQASLKILAPSLKSSGVALVQEISDTPNLFVRGDMVRLEQVIVNLITNAIQAVREEPSPEILIQLTGSDQHLELRVIDNGHGLPDDDPENIFEPFYTTRTVDQGLGLGLSITRHIIQSLDGTITARPTGETNNSGTCFTVHLPLTNNTNTGHQKQITEQPCYAE
ncbi:ATP-binding protein [Parendozoicomonas haliclonae]|uniref:C4-dicarboxylate transport sensor protein DctB n=1 Tax=Parendozoicomonas haliclonae TaxID=1960125 RepID=A0A1X7ALJ0_9GAMM|nr:ATP-binding protein [Parendozoicomonas haliclonae]SMA48436.1 C4-dicarboxylate transport sensor protein DctB [Parendozoicomonas haliclonae]